MIKMLLLIAFGRRQLSSSSFSSSTAAVTSTVVFWLLLAVVVSSSSAFNASANLKQQTAVEAANEPLLRYSFAQFLANPCGLMSSSAAFSQSARINQVFKSIGMRIFTSKWRKQATLSSTAAASSRSNGASLSLSQEAQQFLDPFRQRYNNINSNSLTDEELKVIVQEFLLVLREVKYRSHLMHPQKDLHQCEHIQLSSLPDIKQLLSINQKGQLEVKEIYRALALTAAHLHLMIRDHLDVVDAATVAADHQSINSASSSLLPPPLLRPFCLPMDEPFQQQNIRVLTGKVETLMCLIFPMRDSGDDGSDDKGRNDQLFDVIKNVLMQTFLHHSGNKHGTDCSAREMRSCLVVRYALGVFDVAQQLPSQTPLRHHQLGKI